MLLPDLAASGGRYFRNPYGSSTSQLPGLKLEPLHPSKMQWEGLLKKASGPLINPGGIGPSLVRLSIDFITDELESTYRTIVEPVVVSESYICTNTFVNSRRCIQEHSNS